MAYKNPHMLGSVIPYKNRNNQFFFIAVVERIFIVFRTGSLRGNSGIDVAIPQVFHEGMHLKRTKKR